MNDERFVTLKSVRLYQNPNNHAAKGLNTIRDHEILRTKIEKDTEVFLANDGVIKKISLAATAGTIPFLNAQKMKKRRQDKAFEASHED